METLYQNQIRQYNFKNTVLYNCHENNDLIIIEWVKWKKKERCLIIHANLFVFLCLVFETLLFFLSAIGFVPEITSRPVFTFKNLNIQIMAIPFKCATYINKSRVCSLIYLYMCFMKLTQNTQKNLRIKFLGCWQTNNNNPAGRERLVEYRV